MREIVLAFLAVLLSSCATLAQSYAGPIIDSHAHIRFGNTDALMASEPIGTGAIQKLDDAAGVTSSALIVIAKKGQMEATQTQNDMVLEAASTSRGRFYAVVSVHPEDGDLAMAELERLAKLGAKEVKLHPNTQNFDVADASVSAVVKRCGELGLVVLFDSYKPWDAGEMGKFLVLAAQHPETKIVLAHMGFTYFKEALAFAQLRKPGMANNVWFDLSAIAVAYAGSPVQPELVWTIRKVGTDRFLFGSDWPVDTPIGAANSIRQLGLTTAEQQSIFHDNVVNLLNLGKPADSQSASRNSKQ
jgi:predicted TIM-barrel fold metal-dependent hydrolase